MQLVVGVHKSPNPTGNGVLRPQRDVTTAIIEARKFLHTSLVEEHGVAGIDMQRSRESEREVPQEKTEQKERFPNKTLIIRLDRKGTNRCPVDQQP